MSKFFSSILLLIIAIILGGILIPIGFILTPFIVFLIDGAEEAYLKLADYLKGMAMCIDQLGNVTLEYIFNSLFITEWGYQFGNKMETISSVLGKNQLQGSLTKTGLLLVNILDKINPNHCLKAINNKV